MIQDLIARFENCQILYQQYLYDRKETDETCLVPGEVSSSVSNSAKSRIYEWRNDKTGRSFLGQQYLWALLNWLTGYPEWHLSGGLNIEFSRYLTGSLGVQNPEKKRIVRLLLAQITSDRKAYKKLHHGIQNRKLEYLAGTVDIYNFAFPHNLDPLIRKIGEINPPQVYIEHDVSNDIRIDVEQEFLNLYKIFNSTPAYFIHSQLNNSQIIRLWLFTRLTKTYHGQSDLPGLVQEFKNLKAHLQASPEC
jgi:hypothetical protein